MTNQEIITWLLGMLAAIIVGTITWVRSTLMKHAQRITKVESVAITEHEVRTIVKEAVQTEVKPIKKALDDLQQASSTNTEILTDLRIATGVLVRMASHDEATKETIKQEMERYFRGTK